MYTLPAYFFRLGASDWNTRDLDVQNQLAETVKAEVERDLSTDDFHTSSKLFNSEWLFGTYLMTGIAFCQIAQAHPHEANRCVPTIEKCIKTLLSDEVSAFDTRAWKEKPLESLSGDHGHGAYLGYLNFLLSLYRVIRPDNEFASLNDRISEALARRLQLAPNGLIATYPNEWYPVDNAPAIASIGLHGHRQYTDAKTGLLIQAVDGLGSARDRPRGSGTALAIFFLSRVYPDLGAELFGALRRNLYTTVLNFGAVREYPPGIEGLGDIDSGPVIFGLGFSASGFSIGAARAFGDVGMFEGLYASATFAGVPFRSGKRLEFLTAGLLGNAILLAMFTTPTAATK
jgi:hypothetical protein